MKNKKHNTQRAASASNGASISLLEFSELRVAALQAMKRRAIASIGKTITDELIDELLEPIRALRKAIADRGKEGLLNERR